MKKSTAIIFILAIFAIACNQSKSKSKSYNRLDLNKVSRIEISKKEMSLDSKNSPVRSLTEKQIRLFTEKLNQADKFEYRKYFPSYELFIYLRDGSVRSFRIAGKYIKENNDLCFDFDDENYFSNLYLNAKL